MKVGLFGGSFNPAHQGHLHISNLAVKKLALNQIWWIPTKHNPFKEKSIYSDYQTRFRGCEILTKNNPKIYLKKFDEIQTEKLIKKLQNKYPNYQFFWIAGADNLPRLHEWDNFKNLMKLLPFAIFSRENFASRISRTKSFKIYSKLTHSAKKLPKFLVFRTKNINISSTEIRKNLNV